MIYLSKNMNTVKYYGATKIYNKILDVTCQFSRSSDQVSQLTGLNKERKRLCPDIMSDMT